MGEILNEQPGLALILTFSRREKEPCGRGDSRVVPGLSQQEKEPPLPSSPLGRRIKDEGKGVRPGDGIFKFYNHF